MRAIWSDIHANFEALQAVLADAARHKAQSIYCLGDIVGYGPSPRECLDCAMSWDLTVLGNHDRNLLYAPDDAPWETRSEIQRTLDELAALDAVAAESRLAFLRSLPRQHREEGLLFVHGSPRGPVDEYIFPEDRYNERKMQRNFALVERHCFHGHSHVQGVMTERYEYHTPAEIDFEYRLTDEKALINVGSVGQPRDGDWRAAYVLFDGQRVVFRRVEYDIGTTVHKIQGR